ncbi:MAG: S8 family serine peptidase [Thiotrichales bacterium]
MQNSQGRVASGLRALSRTYLGSTLLALGFVFQGAFAATIPAGVLDAARGDGAVRVIVQLSGVALESTGLANADTAASRAEVASRQTELLSELAGRGVSEVKRFEYLPFLAMEVDEFGLNQLASSPGVVGIYEDYLVKPMLAESTTLIGAPHAWTANFDGTGRTVAILDTGVDSTHPFLSGKVVSEACYSSNIPSISASSLCPGGATATTVTGSGRNCSGVGGCTHGTHVAGIAAGRDPGTTGVNGVGKGANILAIQVFTRFDSTSSCGATAPCLMSYSSDFIKGLERAYALRDTLKIASVNMSLGGGSYGSTCDAQNGPTKAAIDLLRSVGIATVIASGNSGTKTAISSPGCISSAISVGATCDGVSGSCLGGVDTIASYSSLASFVSLVAPGSLIRSSVPGTGYADSNGTSMAAPHVAGAWAVMKQRTPNASVDEILGVLRATGKSVNDTRSGGVVTGMRRIDLAKVLADDADADNIVASADNCLNVANPNQRDTDGDGYGNLCDADLNNDGMVNGLDLVLFRQRFLTNDPHADFNGDGFVNGLDLVMFRQMFLNPPGPSGRAP